MGVCSFNVTVTQKIAKDKEHFDLGYSEYYIVAELLISYVILTSVYPVVYFQNFQDFAIGN